MSRYAMEWAKRQAASGPAAKTVLLLLADKAEGAGHSCVVHHYALPEFARAASLNRITLKRAFMHLRKAGLVATTHVDGVLGNPHLRGEKYQLLIPAGWRIQGAPLPKGKSPDGDVPTAVYRLYNASGALLYVGISDRPERRFRQHASDKHWWREVLTREVTWHASRHSAEAEEERAVIEEDPPYNLRVGRHVAGRKSGEHNQRRRYVVTNSRYGIFELTTTRIQEDIVGKVLGGGPLPYAEDLAKRYEVDEPTIHQALRYLCELGILTCAENGMFMRQWDEW